MSTWQRPPRWNRPNSNDDREMMSYGGRDEYEMDSENYDDCSPAKRYRQQMRDSDDSYGNRNFQESSMSVFDTDPFSDMREPSSSKTLDDPFHDMRLPSSSSIYNRNTFMSRSQQDSDFRQQDTMNKQSSMSDQNYNDFRSGGMTLDSDYLNDPGRSRQDNFSMQRGGRYSGPMYDNNNDDDDDVEENEEDENSQEFNFPSPMNQYNAPMQQTWASESQAPSMMRKSSFMDSNSMPRQQQQQQQQNRMMQRAPPQQQPPMRGLQQQQQQQMRGPQQQQQPLMRGPQQQQPLMRGPQQQPPMRGPQQQQPPMRGSQPSKKFKKKANKRARNSSGPSGGAMLQNPMSSGPQNWNSNNGGFQRNWMNTGGQANFNMQRSAQQNQDSNFHMNMPGPGFGKPPMPLMGDMNEPQFKFQGKELTRTIPNDMQPQNMPRFSNSGPFFCNVCNLTFSPHSELLKHFKGGAHKFKLRLLKSMTTPKFKKPAEVKVASEAPKHIVKSGSSYCDLCKTTFVGNVIEHRQSEEHKANKAFTRPFCALCKQFLRTPARFVKHCKSEFHKLQRSRLAATKAEAEKKNAGKQSEKANDKADEAKENGEEKKEQGGKQVEGNEQSDEFITVDAVGIYEGSGDHQVITLEDSSEDEEQSSVEKPTKKKSESVIKSTSANKDEKTIPDKPVVDQPVGEAFITAGFYCYLCSEFFEDEKFAKTEHCKVKEHVANYKSTLSKQSAEDKIQQIESSSSDNEQSNDKKALKTGENETGEMEVELAHCPKQVNTAAGASQDEKPTSKDEEPTSETAEGEAEPSSTSNQENEESSYDNSGTKDGNAKPASADSAGMENGHMIISNPLQDEGDSCEVCFESICDITIKEESTLSKRSSEDKIRQTESSSSGNEQPNDKKVLKTGENENEEMEVELAHCPKQVNTAAGASQDEQQTNKDEEPTSETAERKAEPSSTSNQENEQSSCDNSGTKDGNAKPASADSAGMENGQMIISNPLQDDDDSCEVCFESIRDVTVKEEVDS